TAAVIAATAPAVFVTGGWAGVGEAAAIGALTQMGVKKFVEGSAEGKREMFRDMAVGGVTGAVSAVPMGSMIAKGGGVIADTLPKVTLSGALGGGAIGFTSTVTDDKTFKDGGNEALARVGLSTLTGAATGAAMGAAFHTGLNLIRGGNPLPENFFSNI